ncbi:MAG: Zn-ribbon protein [Actinomycetia bacterium]|nr:Zn-ribbon protein [Actinomycetes bacterium]
MSLVPLLELQEHDTAIDRLVHRRNTLPERAVLEAATVKLTEIADRLTGVTAARDEVAREERRLDDETRSLEDKAKAVETTMYSGTVNSPKELQAMQADIESLRKHRSDLEDRELEVMDRREALDTDVAAVVAEQAEIEAEARGAIAVIANEEAKIDDDLAAQRAAREAVATTIDPATLRLYEGARIKARGIGAARLIGNQCQGCRLTIPSGEVDRARHAPAGTVTQCDNCGAILVVE